jgi:hypothetical protein
MSGLFTNSAIATAAEFAYKRGRGWEAMFSPHAISDKH